MIDGPPRGAGLHSAVARIADLYDDEVCHRARGRELELNPDRAEDARLHFRAASAARVLRLAMLRHWRLL